MIPKRLVTAIVVLISVVFTINYGAQFVVTGYQPDPAITAVFGAIVGTALALSRRDNNGPGPGAGGGPP